MKKSEKKLFLIPLGGLEEIGKNMTVVQYGDEIIVVDSGLMFPEEDLLGIDIVIPDITYLKENREKIKGIVLTHGHEDHIGALPFVLKELEVPVYGTKLTIGLVEGKLKESSYRYNSPLNVVMPGESISLGCFNVEFIRVSHSVPDAVSLCISTPIGDIVHTGDFKFDQTPVIGEVANFHRFAEIGNRGVLILLSDSTNAERPGYTKSEKEVGLALEEKIKTAKEKVIVATFASNVHRVQQVINAAAKCNRKVAVSGRSMLNLVTIADKLGYLDIPKNIMIELDEIKKYPKNKIALITTGSQGEPMSALTRMARGDHRHVAIEPGDRVILSATPIPGNEKTVSRVVNQLFRLGADVVYKSDSGVHVSGHASREELKMMLNLVKPKYFMPVHGEYRMLATHARLAADMGIDKENIFIALNGNIIEFTENKARIAGKVSSGRVLVDGRGVGDVGNIVLRDRKQLSEDGIVVVVMSLEKGSNAILSGPDIVSRGFVYVRESENLIYESKQKVIDILGSIESDKFGDWGYIKNTVREGLARTLYEKTGRKPMILPIITEI